MKLVMVDPSKSKTDKIRPTTFHHFQNNTLIRTPNITPDIDKNSTSINTSKYKQKNNIEFRDKFGSTIGVKSGQSNASSNDLVNAGKVNNLVVIDGPSTSLDKDANLQEILLGTLEQVAVLKKDDDNLIIKMDPKYNNPKKSSQNKTNVQELSFSKINVIGDDFIVPHTTNKVRKLTFVKTIPVSNGNISSIVGNNTPNYEKTIFNHSKFVKQSTKYSFGNENLVIHKSLDKSSMGIKHSSEKMSMKTGDGMDGIILTGQTLYSQNDAADNNNISEHKFQMYQMDNHSNHETSKDKHTGKQITESKTKLNKIPINPPILEGYSTYTFKVNMKDK